MAVVFRGGMVHYTSYHENVYLGYQSSGLHFAYMIQQLQNSEFRDLEILFLMFLLLSSM